MDAKTISHKITEITSSSVELYFEENISDYPYIKLVVVLDNTSILLDLYSKEQDVSDYDIITIPNKHTLKIDVNMVQLDFLYYKSFIIEFLNEDKETVAKTNTFNVSPNGKKHLYGIINKMQHDYDRLWTLSGTTCIYFVKSHIQDHCEFCYDKELKQVVNTNCSHCKGSGHKNIYTPVVFKARKIKTDTNQFVNEKGVRVVNVSTFNTFNRLNFTLGSFFYDKTTRDYFEIKDAHKASIGGVKTSTTIIGEQLATNDVRVAPLLQTLKDHSLL